VAAGIVAEDAGVVRLLQWAARIVAYQVAQTVATNRSDVVRRARAARRRGG